MSGKKIKITFKKVENGTMDIDAFFSDTESCFKKAQSLSQESFNENFVTIAENVFGGRENIKVDVESEKSEIKNAPKKLSFNDFVNWYRKKYN